MLTLNLLKIFPGQTRTPLCPGEISVMFRARRYRSIRELQSLLLLGAQPVHVTTNAGLGKKKKKLLAVWLNRPARSGYIRVGINVQYRSLSG